MFFAQVCVEGLPFAAFCGTVFLDQAAQPGVQRLIQTRRERMEVYFDNLTDENAALDKLAEDVSLLVQDAEVLVQASGAKLSQKSKAELESALERVKTRGERVKQGALAGARATDRVIREHPYQSLGIVFALGFVFGALIKRS